ncbi:uncharacterized protein [Nicotiana sylvestris]|uniref:uncharacterized protein n=1 Tax=Nicotiana sylvestris TaxID=4096 RepID=UPI00388CC801
MGLRSIRPYAMHRVILQLGRYQNIQHDEDLSWQVIELESKASFPEEKVRRIWHQCKLLGPNTQVRDLSRGKVESSYTAWYGKRSRVHHEPERPAKRPHIQQFTDGAQVQWDWLTKENEYRVTISKLEKQVKELQFENILQAATNEEEKKKLAKENEALRAQIQKMKIVAENPARNAKDEKLIDNMMQKVSDYSFYLNKSESELARARKQLAKNAYERARLVKQLKEKYENEVAGLKKRVISTENKMIKQAKDFKEQNHVAEQTLEARAQQIGCLLQEKGVIKERI